MGRWCARVSICGALIDGGAGRSKCNEALCFGGLGMPVVYRVAATPNAAFAGLADLEVWHSYLCL